MRTTLPLLAGILLLSATAPALADGADTHVINDSGKTFTLECTAARSEAVVNGSRNTITLTGTCTKVVLNGSEITLAVASAAKLAVNGSRNTINVDAAGKIAVNGSQNTITWKQGLAGKAPKIANLGSGNSIKKSP